MDSFGDMGTLYADCVELEAALLDIKNPEERKSRIQNYIQHRSNLKCAVPDFKSGLQWFNSGEPLSLGCQLKGKIVILDFFTYCCINCIHALPHLKKLENKYPVEAGVVVVGVHSAKFDNEKDPENISAALLRYHVTHPVVNDADGLLWNQLGMFCWPTLVILGPQRQPLFQLVGEGHDKDLFEYMEATSDFFRTRGELSPHSLVPASNPSIKGSHLLFPGKVAVTSEEDGTELIAISSTGMHTIVLASAEGLIKYNIGCCGKAGFCDGDFSSALFNAPQGLAFSSPFILYVADTGNHAIRKVDLQNRSVLTVAGNGSQGSDLRGGGVGSMQSLSSPWDLCIYRRSFPLPTPFLCICPAAPPGYSGPGENNKSTPPAAPPIPFHPPAPPPFPPPVPLSECPPPPSPFHEYMKENDQEIIVIAMAGSHQIWGLFLQDSVWWKGKLFQSGTCAALAGTGKEENRNNVYPESSAFAQPSGLAYCDSRKEIMIADSESSSIRSLHIESGKVNAVVGGSRSPDDLFCFGDVDGSSYNVRLQHPLGVAWDKLNNCLYVADSYNHKVKKVILEGKQCSSFIGTGVPGDTTGRFESQLNEPGGICMSVDHTRVFIADTNNHCIKVADLALGTVHKLDLKSSNEEVPVSPRKITDASPLYVRKSGRITLLMKVLVPPSMELTEGAPQRWFLQLPDSTWKSEPTSGTFTPHKVFKINIYAPASTVTDSFSVSVTIKLFLCGEGVCFSKSITNCIEVALNDIASNEVVHESIVNVD